MTDSFIFYRSFAETIELLEPKQAKELVLAMARFALDDEEPELNGVLALLFPSIRAQLDANIQKRREGSKGGAKSKTTQEDVGRILGLRDMGHSIREIELELGISKSRVQRVLSQNCPKCPTSDPNDPKPTLADPKPTLADPKANVNDNDNVNANVNANESTRSRPRFVPPTAKEVDDYLKERGFSNLSFDGEMFVNFYASKGWKIGKNPVVNWKCCVSTWIQRYRKEVSDVSAETKRKLESRSQYSGGVAEADDDIPF